MDTVEEQVEIPKEQSGNHHGVFKEGPWTAAGTIMGCGIMQLYGLYMANTPSAKPALEKLKKRLEEDAQSPTWQGGRLPCRTLIGMLGFYQGDSGAKFQVLKDLGFVELATYDNAAHPMSKDKQKLFILTW